MAMTNTEGSEHLDRIESLIEETNRGARTRLIVESNNRAIQAMLEARATERLEHEQSMRRLENIEERLSKVQEILNKRLAGIEANRPTIFQKLNKIENKLDSLTKIEAKLDRLLEEK